MQLDQRGRSAVSLGGAIALSMAIPATVAAHQLTERYQAPLPLLAYIGGAAIAVAMSFAFVALRAPGPSTESVRDERAAVMPGWTQLLLRALGLLAWLWILAQALYGGSGEADVASLFLWVYGWVGLALVSALIGPLWSWIDPFSTLHMLLGAAGRRLGLGSGEPAEYPRSLGMWPAVIGFGLVVWLELVARIEGGSTLGLVLVGYTLVTVAAMSYFGRETWRQRGEVFSVWFSVLGRFAPFRLDGPPEEGRLSRRPLGAGLRGDWSLAQLVLLTLGTGSIIFAGLSQTQLFFDLFVLSRPFGLPGTVVDTVVAFCFFALLLALVLLVARPLGRRVLGAGLLPVAVGYLIAHYVVFLLVDGQRMVHALNDPLQRGDNLLPFDLGFHEPTLFLPTAVVWSIQLAAVVGGHIIGAWAGHAALERSAASSDAIAGHPHKRSVSARQQLPLAALMVLLTTLTLWSLGQAVITEPEAVSGPSRASIDVLDGRPGL
ncbi:hypothetical protein BH23CHL6_BH23CHL6_10940 [soil metagenome]